MSSSVMPGPDVLHHGGSPFGCIGRSSSLDSLDGQSQESEIILIAHERIADHFCLPISRLRNDPVRRFYELFWTWKKEVKLWSDVDAICAHPAYQQIIGMGEAALPLILQELQQGDDYWFWALKAITGEDPVPEEDAGKIGAMKRYWTQWGREHGYG